MSDHHTATVTRIDLEELLRKALALAADTHDPEDKHAEGWGRCTCPAAKRVRALSNEIEYFLRGIA
jgi:hypothetical protein